MKKITIVTICYNEPNLEKTCESVVNQTFQDFEWVVVDGGSGKKTQQIFDKYKHRIDKFVSEPDDGRYNGMNKGIDLVEGEYINFLNAGDYYYDNNVLKKVFAQGLDKDIVYGNLNLISENGNVIKAYPNLIDKNYLIMETLPHPASFIKKELFDKYGKYDERYGISADYEKWVNFIIKNNCTYKHIDVVCSTFNLNGLSSVNEDLCIRERNEIANKYFSLEEIKAARKNNHSKHKYKFIEQIFSLKNISDNVKVVTILGIHIKVKR